MTKRNVSTFFSELRSKRRRKTVGQDNTNRISGGEQTNNTICEQQQEVDQASDPIVLDNLLHNLRLQDVNTSIATEKVNLLGGNENQYILLDLKTLEGLLCKTKCAECNGISLKIELDQAKSGFAHLLHLKCTNCEAMGLEPTKATTCTSERSTGSSNVRHYDVNNRVAMAFASIGKGYAGVERFAATLGMNAFTDKTFCKITQNLHTGYKTAVELNLSKTRKQVEKAYRKLPENLDLQKYTPVNIAVSYDGSWLTRGRTSKHGVGCVIDLLTGYIIDFEVMSKYCHECWIAKVPMGEDTPDFHFWLEGHAADCAINHTGSSGAMEMMAAARIWERSKEMGLQYTTLLSDGDCKTHQYLNGLAVYGSNVHITKEECVNHVSKRLGTALRQIVKDCRSRSITLGGRSYGSLKEVTIKKLTDYYYKAIRRNKGNVAAMKNDIFATVYHCAPTDENPQHSKCPSGEQSWCFYQSAITKGKQPGAHDKNLRTALNEKVLQHILPIYERLTKEDLLERCSKCRTQNANESLHSRIWRKCPKEQFVSKNRVEIAVSEAVCEYNSGTAKAAIEIQRANGVSPTTATLQVGQRKDQQREKLRRIRNETKYKNARRTIQFAKVRRAQQLEKEEGVSYDAGKF